MNYMRFIATLVACFVLLTSCEKVEELKTIEGIKASTTIELEFIPLNIFGFGISTPIDLRQVLKEQTGVSGTIEVVRDIKLTGMSMDAVLPEGSNFDFLEEVTLYLKTEELLKKEIATATDIQDGQISFELTTTDDFLDQYVKSDSLELVIEYKSSSTEINRSIKINMVFEAKLNI